MNHSASRIVQLRGRGQTDWVGLYLAEQLATKDEKTQYAYALVLHDFTEWLARMPGSQGQFDPRAMTKTAVKTYFDEKKAEKRPHTKAQLTGVGASLSESERPLDTIPFSV